MSCKYIHATMIIVATGEQFAESGELDVEIRANLRGLGYGE